MEYARSTFRELKAIYGSDEERVAMERTYTRSLMSGLSTEDMRTRSPKRAPPVRGELGSTASSATRKP